MKVLSQPWTVIQPITRIERYVVSGDLLLSYCTTTLGVVYFFSVPIAHCFILFYHSIRSKGGSHGGMLVNSGSLAQNPKSNMASECFPLSA